MTQVHGTRHSYNVLKCRCAECKEAASAHARKMRATRKPLAPDDPRHGKFSTYINHKCRCAKCSQANADKNYASRRGLSRQDMLDILEEQDNRCASCGRSFDEGLRTHFDHDHETGKYREVLCGPCNMALGLLGDDPVRIQALLEYILKHKQG